MHRVKTAVFSVLFSLAFLSLSIAQAQSFTVLHAFTGQQDGGCQQGRTGANRGTQECRQLQTEVECRTNEREKLQPAQHWVGL